jgi:sugar phosphate isomerase/epimerase
MPSDPLFSIAAFTTAALTFEEDLALYAEIGSLGIGLWEAKLDPKREAEQLAAKDRSGLQATLCIPANPCPLPADPYFDGPDSYEARVESMCRSIRTLAAMDPARIVLLTGGARGLSRDEAWTLAVTGLRTAASCAAELGLRVAIEPVRADLGADVSIVQTIPETLELIDDIGTGNVDILYDIYHLWDTENIIELTATHASQIAGVHMADYRTPQSSWADRRLPGDGTIDLRAIIGALEGGGFTGWYELELVSDPAVPDSPAAMAPREMLEAGRRQFLEIWHDRTVPRSPGR